MPKLPLLLACFLVMASIRPAAAQRDRTSQVGLKFGASLAQYRGEDTFVGHGNLAGYCGGAMFYLPVSPVFSVQPELLYSQKGTKGQSFRLPITMYASTMYAVGSQRLDYLEVPVLAKLRSHVGPFLEVGPTFSYLLSAHLDDSQNSLEDRGDFKAFEVGYAAGVGFQSEQGLMLGARYTRGLTSVVKDGSYRSAIGKTDVYNQVFQLYVGFIFKGRSSDDFL